jgi:hypothetical protein
MLGEGGLVDMAVYPVAIFEVEIDEAVDDVYAGEHGEKIAIVLGWREVFDLVITGLTVLGLIKVFGFALERGVYKRTRWVRRGHALCQNGLRHW